MQNSQLLKSWAAGADLERVLAVPVSAFAYPYGEVTDAAAACVERHFAAGFTTRPGANVLLTSTNCLYRIDVQPGDSVCDLWLRIHFRIHPVERVLSLCRRVKRWLTRRTAAPSIAPAIKSDAA
jgi:hypothetical protein